MTYQDPAYGMEPPRKSFSIGTLLYTIFRVFTLLASIPLIVVAAKLLHFWPVVFRQAGVALGGAIVSIVTDILAVYLFWNRSKAFPIVIVLDVVGAVLAAVGVVGILMAGFNSSDTPVSPVEEQQEAAWAKDQVLGVAFAFIVCGLRILSFLTDAISSCMMCSRRRSQRTVQTQELY